MYSTIVALLTSVVIFAFAYTNRRIMMRLDDERLEQFWRMPASRVRRIADIARVIVIGIGVAIFASGVVGLIR